jgi:hypothetical protein
MLIPISCAKEVAFSPPAGSYVGTHEGVTTAPPPPPATPEVAIPKVPEIKKEEKFYAGMGFVNLYPSLILGYSWKRLGIGTSVFGMSASFRGKSVDFVGTDISAVFTFYRHPVVYIGVGAGGDLVYGRDKNVSFEDREVENNSFAGYGMVLFGFTPKRSPITIYLPMSVGYVYGILRGYEQAGKEEVFRGLMFVPAGGLTANVSEKVAISVVLSVPLTSLLLLGEGQPYIPSLGFALLYLHE